jgi:hypothetical protein
MVTMSNIHAGAYLNGGELHFTNHHLELEYASHREDTNSENYTGRNKYIQCVDDCIIDVHEGKHCIINGTVAPYGDAFLGLDINLKGNPNPNEVHQYKRWTKYTLNETDFINECNKLFIIIRFFLAF